MPGKNSNAKKPRSESMIVFITVAAIILIFSLIIVIMWVRSGRQFSVAALLLLLIIPAAITIGIVAMMCKRFRAISDAAKKQDGDKN